MLIVLAASAAALAPPVAAAPAVLSAVIPAIVPAVVLVVPVAAADAPGAAPAVLLLPAVLPAVDDTVWDELAGCESDGDWQADTGNGYYGGLQIWPPTWEEADGLAFADRPDHATRREQITVAEEILRRQGWEAWPSCSRDIGLLDADPAPDYDSDPPPDYGPPPDYDPDALTHSRPPGAR